MQFIPSIVTIPEVGLSNKPAICNIVVFPAPESPISATTCPLVTLKLISFTTAELFLKLLSTEVSSSAVSYTHLLWIVLESTVDHER